MKKTTRALLLGIVFSLLLGHGLVGIQPSYAHFRPDCEWDRFNAFMNANDQYTGTFYSWYFGQPVSCQQQCGGCNPINNPSCADCINSCDNSRYNSFRDAQDGLITAASQTCPQNLDACAEAHYRKDQCDTAFYFPSEINQ